MFRAAFLSTVLALTIGQNATLLCGTWCDAHAAAESWCHHEDSSTSPSVAGAERCDRMGLVATAVLRKDLRRGPSSHASNQAIPSARYQHALLTSDDRLGPEPWREWSLEKRPRSTTLRI